jgi:hypothetical protein
VTKKLLLITTLFVVGCLVPSGPDDNTPDPNQLSRQVEAALSGVPAEQCETLGYTYLVLSDYLREGDLQIDNQGELLDVRNSMLEQGNWPFGTYNAINDLLNPIFDEYHSEPEKPIFDQRSKLADLFGSIGAGALEAAK